MILVDTSIWIDHVRRTDEALVRLLEDGVVVQHPFVIGEIALGVLKNRAQIIAELRALPTVAVASHDEVMLFVERRRLHGVGIGLVDVHLLVSAHLTPDCRLWARDRRLRGAAEDLGIAAPGLRH